MSMGCTGDTKHSSSGARADWRFAGSEWGNLRFRRSLFQVPRDTIVDDFVTPLIARIRTGCRIVYDEEAIAYEETPPEISVEFRRRARIGAGGFQSIAVLWPLLDPRRGAIAFTFMSHKVLRWLCPFFLLGAAVANVRLVNVGIYGVSLVAVSFSVSWRSSVRFCEAARRWEDDASGGDVRDNESCATRGFFPVVDWKTAGCLGANCSLTGCCTRVCCCTVALIYVRPAEIVPAWETIPFVDILTGISAFVAIFSLASKPRPFANLPHDKLLLTFWVLIAVSSVKVWVWAYDSVLAFAPVVVCYFLIRAAVTTQRQLTGLIYLLIGLNVFQAINGIVQFHTGVGLGNVQMRLDRIYGPAFSTIRTTWE